MNLLIKAELLKLKKNKLVYFGGLLGILPLLLSGLFASGSESFQIFGKYDLLSYTNGMFSTIVLGIGIYAIYFAMIINSIISTEINSDLIIYEIVGKNKRNKIYLAKVLVVLIFSALFLLLVLFSCLIGYKFFLTRTPHIMSTHDTYELGNFIYSIVYYFGLIIILAAFSFLGLGNSLIIVSFLVNIGTMKLCAITWLAPYVIGAPVYSNVAVYQHHYPAFLGSQYLVLFLVVCIMLYLSLYLFKKRDL